jgi:quercetin dioxygenase-like cupin family protein
MWAPPGARCCLSAGEAGVLKLDSVTLPVRGSGQDVPAASAGDTVPELSELADCEVQVTGDRQFRVLFGPGRGCDAATQFVGEIPPGRAPEHSHPYDEVVLVLAGEGVLHAGAASRSLTKGSCVHLPPGRPHCLENTGAGTLRVLGVFHPGGSPAAKEDRH